MIKKYALLIVLAVGLGYTAQAAEISHLNDKIDELEVEQEMEALEQYGESAEAEVTLEETKLVNQKAKQLEKEIAQMRRENTRSKKKVNSLTKKFQAKDKLANRTQAQHRKVEKQHNQLNSKVSDLQAKVDKAEQKAVDAITARKSIERNIIRLKKERQSLAKRLKDAKRVYAQNRSTGSKYMKAESRLKKQNAKLKQQLATK